MGATDFHEARKVADWPKLCKHTTWLYVQDTREDNAIISDKAFTDSRLGLVATTLLVSTTSMIECVRFCSSVVCACKCVRLSPTEKAVETTAVTNASGEPKGFPSLSS